jgi:hypothetical protein
VIVLHVIMHDEVADIGEKVGAEKPCAHGDVSLMV